jgi:hypothetical protein
MTEPYLEHPSEDDLERFILNMTSESELETLEGHVMSCEHCVEQLEALQIRVAATRLALQNLEAKAASEKSVEPARSWRGWFTIPRLSSAAAGALAFAGAILCSIPSNVSITAFRGTETTIVSEWRPLRMHLNADGLNPGAVAVELVDNNGSIIWKGPAAVRQDKVDVDLPRLTKSGPHFLRLYSVQQAGSDGELLREFSLEAKLRM